MFAQTPPIEPGVSQELARWRAARYSDVRYKLNLTLEKMSPVLKGTMEIRVRVSGGVEEKGSGGAQPGTQAPSPASPQRGEIPPIILDWRKIAGHEKDSTVTNITLNEIPLFNGDQRPEGVRPSPAFKYHESNDHLILPDAVKAGENVIKLDFTSPILTSGSAITRYVDKEDGSEYIYSLFVPSDASTAFPVFDQPDLKARFELFVDAPKDWHVVSNTQPNPDDWRKGVNSSFRDEAKRITEYRASRNQVFFHETKPVSTYVFAFAAGPWEKVSTAGATATKSVPPALAGGEDVAYREAGTADGRVADTAGRSASPGTRPPANAGGTDPTAELATFIYVRKSQAAKFKPHAVEVFRLNREAVKYFEQYFDYKFPFPKYDLVLIPEFPFGGMEHAGATFLRESSIIFPQEPTKNDLVSRATLIFHETAHQWFGDTVTMRWFDDLWLKEGFATFTAYKALEKIMPEMNAWKVFYERIKQGAYQTDSTRGTTAIYQPIANLSAAKSAYGNIVYNKAPAFLRQAEFFLGEENFRRAIRAFLKNHEFNNAEWTDLVQEFRAVIKFETTNRYDLNEWANTWVKQRGLPRFRVSTTEQVSRIRFNIQQQNVLGEKAFWPMRSRRLIKYANGASNSADIDLEGRENAISDELFCDHCDASSRIVFPNYGDYGYGIFLLDEKSRDYVLKNIQNEKDPFLRTMMWGALWDSVREGELDPKAYIQLAVKNLPAEEDESIIASVLGRTATAFNYYLEPADQVAVINGLEDLLVRGMRNSRSLGQRLTYYRSFLNVGSSMSAREIYKQMLAGKFWPKSQPIGGGVVAVSATETPLRTKDRFDIVTRLLILNDPDAPKLLADLEKTETSDDAKRYAYAARAGIGTAENKAKYWNDFVSNKEISESWIEAAFGPWNSIRHSDLTLPYLERALKELPNHKRNRKIFFVNGWLGAFIGGQRSAEALAVVNKFLADNPGLDNDLRLKVLENVDVIERAVRIRGKFSQVRSPVDKD